MTTENQQLNNESSNQISSDQDSANVPESPDLAHASSEEKQQFFQRTSNTFMRRRTHMSQNAGVGLEACADYFVSEELTNMRDIFPEPHNKLTFEIGFGMGSSLIEMAQSNPNTNYVGIEVHEPGLGLTAYNANKHCLTNLKLINGDAIKVLKQLPDNHIDTIQLYFPDPWQKKRHFKRRFVSHERMPLVVEKLVHNGLFHTATDWEHYAFWMLDVLDNTVELENVSGKDNFHPRPDFRPITKFEKRGIDRGHGVWDLMYKKSE